MVRLYFKHLFRQCSCNTVWLCIVTRYRGGGTSKEKRWDGKRTTEIRSDAFDAQGRRVETVVTMSSDAPAVTNAVTVYDHLGRVVSVATPLGVTSNFHDGASSRLIRVSRTGSPDTLYEYEAGSAGVPDRTAIDIDSDGQISYAGPDRITATHETYEQDASNVWWRVTSQAVWAETNSAACVTSSVTRVRLTGFGTPAPAALELSGGAILTAQTETLDRHGSVTRVSTYTDAGAAAVWTVTETPGSVQPAIQKTVAGRTVSVVSSTAVTNAYTFDGFGRQVSATDGRSNTTLTAYNDLGLVAHAEDAASNRTTYAYDGLGRQIAVTDPLTNTTHTAYDHAGNVTAQWGATYPVAYTYDTAGRRTSMRTFRDENSEGDETRWLYDHATGLLTNKVYADGSCVRYAYTPSGLLASRVWSRGITASYAYDALGQLTNVHYSGNTPDISFAYDRLGRVVSAVTAVSSNLFEYAGLDLVSETQNGVIITRSIDAFGRSAGFDMGSDYSAAYGYDTFGRLHSVSSSVCSVCSVVNYSCLPGSDLVSGYTAGPMAVTKTYEPRRNLISAVSNHVNHVNPVLISAYDYANDAAGRRVSRNVDSFDYNARSEVIGAVIGTNDYGYVYDAIGNRVATTENTKTTEYLANELNQYTQISVPSVVNPTYDADGNMTRLGEWYHTWDAENRLVRSEPYGFATNGTVRLEYVYNHKNLRIAKIEKRLTGRGAGYPFDPSQPGTWDAVKTRRYVWDGHNIAAEIVIDEVAPSTNVTYYTWGLDLSGTLQGAGGVDGLLAVIRSDGTFFPCYDANGNVTEYVDGSGNIRAHYEYSPFGETIAQSGDLADTFTHRFSTKPFDAETGLVMYQLRPYAPGLGRWMSRDPIEEKGSLKLYGFVSNDPINSADPFGLWKVRLVGSNWEDGGRQVVDAFDTLKRNMPAYITRLREWMAAAAKLPDECAYKRHFQQELTKLYGILGVMEIGLNSDVEIKIYSKRMNDDVYAKTIFGWVYDEFKGKIYLNSHGDNAYTDWGTKTMNTILFHELSHVAGVLHDVDKTEYWSDNANNVDRIASNPTGFSLVPAVLHSAQKVGDKCCPSVMKWSP